MTVHRGMHVKTSLLHSVGNIRQCHHEILQSSDETAVRRWVSDRGAVHGRQLGAGVNRSRYSLAVRHVGAVDDLFGVLSLGEEEAMGGARDADAEEVLKRAKVLHGELRAKAVNDEAQQPCSRCSKHNVVDVQEEEGGVSTLLENEQRHVGLGGSEADRPDEAREAVEPCSGRLLQSI